MGDWDDGAILRVQWRYQTHCSNTPLLLLRSLAETPPPLSTIADQVHAVSLSTSIVGTAGLKEWGLRVAATTAPEPPAAAATQTKPLKRGFLDAKPHTSSKQVGQQILG